MQVDSLAGLFLILTGVVSAPLFLAARTRGTERISRALRPLLVLCVVGVIVVDNVFEFLIVFELTVVAIYALISVRYDGSARAARRVAHADARQARRRRGARRAWSCSASRPAASRSSSWPTQRPDV